MRGLPLPRPGFWFLPGDWLRNAKLRRCSLAERGAWLEVMCLMHDSDTYGVLHWTLKEIAKASNVPVKTIQALAEREVLKGCDTGFCAGYSFVPSTGRKQNEPVILLAAQEGPVWYSSRMLKDEYIRQVRASSGGNRSAHFAEQSDEQSADKGASKVNSKVQQQQKHLSRERVVTDGSKGEVGPW